MDLSFSQSEPQTSTNGPEPKGVDLLSDTFARFGLNMDLLGKDMNRMQQISNKRIGYCILTEADLKEE